MLRATLKSMLSRKLRLVLSGLAVILGVMFVSGSFVLTDTLGRSFDGLFTNIFTYTDIQVSKPSQVRGLDGQTVPGKITPADVTTVSGVPGVARAVGTVFVDGAKIVGKDKKVVPTTGAPRFGGSWTGSNELVEIRSGREPAADNEIMISANIAKTTGYQIGDTVPVLTVLAPAVKPYTLVGIVGYQGGRDSLAGESSVYFTLPVAQRVMLGTPGSFATIEVSVAGGTNLADVKSRIAAALGADFSVQTGDELAAESANGVKQALQAFNYLLLGFAGIALFVGTFLIFNTFSIIVAQRTRELALFRAMGAARGQVIGSVLTEAVVIGTVSAIIGLALGVGVAAGIGPLLGGALSGGNLELASLAVPLSAVIASLVVGLGVTIVAAVLPALRASRIAPVAAMRDAATPDRSLTALTTGGAIVLVIGGVALGLGLAGTLSGDANLWAVLGGVLTCFVGIALLTPLISRPVIAGLGRLIGFSPAGRLGQRNSSRNPRRTAVTAAALMIGVALVTGVSVVFSSLEASIAKQVDTGLDAEVVVSADPFAGGLVSIDPSALAAVRAVDGVQAVTGLALEPAKVDGQDGLVFALDDYAAANTILRMKATAGSLRPGAGQAIVDDKTAAEKHWTVGSTIALELARGPATVTISGVYEGSTNLDGLLIGPEVAQAGFNNPAPLRAYVAVRDGADVDAVLKQIKVAIADLPEVNAYTVDQFVAQTTQIFDFVLVLVQLLLALAMVIAVLGVINTLALSMVERTRELGLLRAVGFKRGQVMWMVTVESVIICVFGALLGIAVGVGLGVAVFQALRDQGLTELALPWPLMAGYLIASVVVGLAAGLLPALRAARLDVLKAIAYE